MVFPIAFMFYKTHSLAPLFPLSLGEGLRG
jgi:hypothetical protein